MRTEKTKLLIPLITYTKQLNAYAGKEFGDDFFQNYIYESTMPNYKELFETVGITLEQKSENAYFGPRVSKGVISSDPTNGSPAYAVGFDKGDKIVTVNGTEIDEKTTFSFCIKQTQTQ